MSNGIIIYKSKYGSTKKYAQWLAEDLRFVCMEISSVKIKELMQYDKIILCGAIYASGISGLSYLKKHFQLLKEKQIAVFCVGASPYDEKTFSDVRSHNLKGGLSDLPMFYGRGAWKQSEMKFIDRTLCKLLQNSLAKKDPAIYEPWEAALMSAIGQDRDWTDKAYLVPLIEYFVPNLRT